MDEELINRIGRIYAAINATEEADLTKLKAPIAKTTEKYMVLYQDFRGGRTNEELSNFACSVIHNIANLGDHLKKWAVRNGQDKGKIGEAVNRSLALQIVTDLSNNDKHGYPPRDGGRSDRSPRLVRINQVLRVRPKPEPGSSVTVTLSADGTPQKSGSGSAKAVIVGDVVDKDSNKIDDLDKIAGEAVQAWEQLLSEFNVTLPSH